MRDPFLESCISRSIRYENEFGLFHLKRTETRFSSYSETSLAVAIESTTNTLLASTHDKFPRLDTDSRLSPMSPLSIISAFPLVSHLSLSPRHSHHSSLRRQTYLIVFPVLSRIHCGIGLFCFCALASFCFVLKVLWDYHRR